jgi:outer membrane immunogenic protein
MKRVLLVTVTIAAMVGAGSAHAADLGTPVYKAPVAAPPVVYSWTGWYIGANGGYSWGRGSTDVTETLVTTVTFGALAGSFSQTAFGSGTAKLNGALGGVQAGYNWQTDRFVWGIEGDIQATGQRGGIIFCPTGNLGGCAFNSVTENVKLPWFGTLRGRVGVAWDRVLFYATGGLAVAEIKVDGAESFAGAQPVLAGPFGSASRNSTRIGWVVGGGIEGAIDNNWSVKAEYLHMDLGSVDNTVTASSSANLGLFIPATLTLGLNSAFHTRFTDDIVRVGLNYKFGWAPPPAATRY